MLRRRALRLSVVLGSLAAIPLAIAANFSVTGSDTAAKTLNPTSGTTQTGTVSAAGDLNVSGGSVAVTITGGGATSTANIDNSGKIRQTASGRAIRNSSGIAVIGIENRAGATISANGDDAIQVSVPGSSVTVNNAGTISSGNNRAFNAREITSNTFNNLSTGIARGTAADAVRPGTNGIVTNAGLIEALPNTLNSGGVIKADSDEGIKLDVVSTSGLPVTGVSVTNSGTITGRHGITGGANSAGAFNMSVTNQAGGTIRGIDGSGINIDSVVGGNRGDATVVNDGNIFGDFDSVTYNTGDGDGVDVDGLVTLTNNGIIRGRGAGGLGSDGGASNPEGVSVGGGTIINNSGAEITGQDTSGFGTKGHGILADDSSGGTAPGTTSVTNAGLIRGYDSYAIRFIGNRADSIANNAGGNIRGGGNAAQGPAIQMGDGADTLSNSGSIVGDNGLAIDLEAGNDTLHILGGSASISGDVSGGSGSNTLDFDPGASLSFSYSGVLSNFSAVEIKSGTVSLSGASSYAGDTTVTAGTLVAVNSTGSATGTGSVTLRSAATLGGNGHVGAVLAEAGAILAPSGVLTVDSLSLASGAKLKLALGASSGRLDVSGALGFSGGGTLVIDILDNGIVAGTDYTLLNFGSASGFTTANVSLGSVPPGLEGSLEVTTNAVVLRAPAEISVTPSSLSFGNIVVDASSAVQSVTVSNPGTVPLQVGALALGGSHPGDFVIVANGCTGAVAASASCEIDVRFTPGATGSRSANLSIPSNASGSPELVSLSGSGVAANYSLQASASGLGFGNQPVGSTSSGHSLNLSNNGNSPITVSGFSAGGSHPADFAIASDGCSGHLLAVGASCSVSFSFTPGAAGSRSAVETVSSSPAQTGASASFTLGGTGTQASVGFSPASLAFGNQPVSSSSLPQPLVLSNTGDAPLSITSIAASGDFSASHNCAAVLAPAASCQVDVTFSPSAAGARNGMVSLVSNAPSSPDTAGLSGTGTQAGLGVSGQLAFGSRTVGTPTAPQNVTVTNTGTATLYVGTPTLGGSHPGDFSIASNGCGSGIAPAATCVIGVVFTPTATSTRSASLLIPSNAPGSPASLPLSGTGLSGGAKPGKLTISAIKVSAKEAVGTAVFKVARTGGRDGAVSVHYATADGTALAGEDYQSVSGNLTWESGDVTPRLVTVNLVDDLQVETPETFTLALSAPTGGAVLGNALSTASITSDDKAGSLSFVGSSLTVSENAGSVTVTLRRTGGNGNAVGIHYATADGTALAGTDYGATSGDLSWAAGDVANKSFTIPITWDSASEKAEKFSVLLSLPTGGAKLGSPKTLKVTIGNVNH
ncbi:choice-of-anchor D domain-containing protein [Solimonas sp. K1W22B-7]|uniref:beta strand repeat-containing protein n=1 Tax=Solimonas sp. K1W22B-7 TaxID=2303331 RepID=UPI000E32FDB3|nr:choice-of-anchor D domain-containing protein [Solimonas sp. K1W22B-7]AXQ30122.1 choice-of-anchor D domain-containing protein [Solimonas sp. K1W22B-7]